MSEELKQFLIQLDLIGVKLPYTCWPYEYSIMHDMLLSKYLDSQYGISIFVDAEDYPAVLKSIIDKRRSCERQRKGT